MSIRIVTRIARAFFGKCSLEVGESVPIRTSADDLLRLGTDSQPVWRFGTDSQDVLRIGTESQHVVQKCGESVPKGTDFRTKWFAGRAPPR